MKEIKTDFSLMRFAPVSFAGITGVAALAALLALTGCAPKQPVTSAGKTPQATAPALGEKQTVTTQAATPQKTATADTSGPAVATEPDQTLIDAAQQAYNSGVEHYKAGQYPAARSDFDRAVDIYLTSGHNLKTDTRLNDAFEKLVDDVNSLEMDALQQGTGFGQQQEAAPVDVANDITFPVDPNVTARARAELKTTQSDLPLVVNDYVASYINYFSNSNKGHNTIKHSLERAGHYHAMIAQVLIEEGVPQDLIYQAVAETGFQPRAVNRRSGASGMWQFMPFTAAQYGLVRNAWVDERFDPVKSTQAYARYIKDLHAQFGDWYLAMAAYDWGAGYVQRSVQRTGYADFWELYRRNVLPQETKNYVPIILAATIMAKNPAQYGLTDMAPDPPLVTDVVSVNYSIDLRLVADLVGSTSDEIVGLNPSLLRMRTPPGASFDLRLPVGTKELYAQRVELIPEEHRDSWRYYTVASGDSLDSIAQRYHVKAAEIASLNKLQASTALETGNGLLIPVPPAPVMAASHARYRVRRGDTVVTVADRFGVTAAQLRCWNHLRGNHIPAGRVVYVSQPVVAHHRSSHGPKHSSHKAAPATTTGKKSASAHPSHASTTKKTAADTTKS